MTPDTNAATADAPLTCDCPDCGISVPFARRPLNGEIVECGGCGLELEVTSTNPISVEAAPEVEEDWGE